MANFTTTTTEYIVTTTNFTDVNTSGTNTSEFIVIADEGKFNPNANVPVWVNIVVPLAGAVLFSLVLYMLHTTDKEIPVEQLEAFVSMVYMELCFFYVVC